VPESARDLSFRAAYAVQNTFGILHFRNTMPPDSANSGQALSLEARSWKKKIAVRCKNASIRPHTTNNERHRHRTYRESNVCRGCSLLARARSMLARSTVRNLIECRDELNVLPCQRRGRERVSTGIWNFLSAHRFRAVSRCSDAAEPLAARWPRFRSDNKGPSERLSWSAIIWVTKVPHITGRVLGGMSDEIFGHQAAHYNFWSHDGRHC
jgi:hypothetical protein